METQTILTMNTHSITRNHRISASHPAAQEWRLNVEAVRRRDAGFYMCQVSKTGVSLVNTVVVQVNTDPMRSQVGYLEVVEPPAILAAGTSRDLAVREGEDVLLSCRAAGHPAPRVTWKREKGKQIRQKSGNENSTVEILCSCGQ